MKFRKGFVTNSSSSSFVCEICGRTESGFDLSLRDVEMMECVNGHVFCIDESLELPQKEEIVKYIIENQLYHNWYGDVNEYNAADVLSAMDVEDLFDKYCSDGGFYDVPEFVCPICQFHEYSEYDMAQYLLKEYGIPRDEVFTEVKKFNKRRKKLYDSEYITYVCREHNLNPTEIASTWKDRFGTYAEFNRYINDR